MATSPVISLDYAIANAVRVKTTPIYSTSGHGVVGTWTTYHL